MIDITKLSGIDRLMADIKKRVKASAISMAEEAFTRTDNSVRSQYEGKPSEEVFKAAQRIFNQAGLDAPDDALHKYALAVSKAEPYKFNIDVRIK